MPTIEHAINEMMMDTYNAIARVEQAALSSTRLKDLSITEIHTIDAIGKTRSTMGELANALSVTMATLTVCIDKLERKEYVRRYRGESDRRVVYVELTRNGVVALRLHNMYHLRLLKEVLEGYSAQDKEVLCEVLTRINHYFRKSAQPVASIKSAQPKGEKARKSAQPKGEKDRDSHSGNGT